MKYQIKIVIDTTIHVQGIVVSVTSFDVLTWITDIFNLYTI